MLGIGGKFASSKGMVETPSLVGLSRSDAESAITSAGLIVGSIGTTSGSSSQNNTVASQGIAAGLLVDYETVIPFTVYTYTAPSGPYVVSTEQVSATCAYTESVPTGSYCSGTTLITTYTTNLYTQYKRNWSDGSVDYYLSYCRSEAGSYEQSNSTECQPDPPAPPPTNCTSCASSYNVSITTNNCASGRGWYSVCNHPTGCVPAVTETSVNCVPLSQLPADTPICTVSCGSVWSGSCGGTIAGERLYAQRCTNADCSESVTRWSEPC